MAPKKRDSRPEGQDPDRAHGDDERANGVAPRVRIAVKGHEHQDGPVHEHSERDSDCSQSLAVHLERNGRRDPRISLNMAAFFGFHMPTFTFPGFLTYRLFDRVVHNATPAEKAGFDLV